MTGNEREALAARVTAVARVPVWIGEQPPVAQGEQEKGRYDELCACGHAWFRHGEINYPSGGVCRILECGCQRFAAAQGEKTLNGFAGEKHFSGSERSEFFRLLNDYASAQYDLGKAAHGKRMPIFDRALAKRKALTDFVLAERPVGESAPAEPRVRRVEGTPQKVAPICRTTNGQFGCERSAGHEGDCGAFIGRHNEVRWPAPAVPASAPEPTTATEREFGVLVEALRKQARYAAAEYNYDGDLTPERTTYWVAADRLESLSATVEAQAARIAELEDLIGHIGVHEGYRRSGYDEMTTPQRALYDRLTGAAPAPGDE